MERQPAYHQGDRVEYLDHESQACHYGKVIRKCKKHRTVFCGEDDPNFGCQHLDCFNYPEEESFECRKADYNDNEIYYLVIFDNGKHRCIPVAKLNRA